MGGHAMGATEVNGSLCHVCVQYLMTCILCFAKWGEPFCNLCSRMIQQLGAKKGWIFRAPFTIHTIHHTHTNILCSLNTTHHKTPYKFMISIPYEPQRKQHNKP
jgi:hypothetical protein